VVRAVKNDVQRAVHVTALDAHATLVRVEVHLKVLNASRLHKVTVLGRDFLGHECAGKGQRCMLGRVR
jgi:hypothetical protein